jgi:misacylated tRNA(Ala) deacylase
VDGVTERLYQSDSYLREFEAVVAAVDSDEGAIALNRSAFYPGGGGQPHDLGSVEVDGRRIDVTKVKARGEAVWHWLAGPLPDEGSEIRGVIDWERRYGLMRTHTSMHILCGVVWRDYGAQVTGGNMEPLHGHLDFEFETLQQELVAEIEASVLREVEAARDVRVRRLLRAEAFKIPDLIRTKINLLPEGIQHVRTVEIVGLDLQADGGTHVANTREVGAVRVAKYKSKGRINKRIYLELDPADED